MTPMTDAVVYHLYPLGCFGAPARNDFASPPEPRLTGLHAWLDELEHLGASALYLGPVFESTAHGYDTADYFCVDRRLGDDDTLAAAADDLHRRGMRLILDGVFHHVGRDFWAFADVRERRERSAYRDWFCLDFDRSSPFGDPFAYEGWDGHFDLVKLNLDNPAVRDHLFAAVDHWIDRFGIDGLRLDAADRLDVRFQRDLARHVRARRPGFWLMGEVVHGDYRHWANPETLDATTNYECYKGLYSSHNDRNFFEIAYSLDRQSGPSGIYRDLALYTFADNHDVDRVASRLRDPAHLYPLYALLFTMPGIPSIYYGSEWGLGGQREPSSDAPLRPALDLDALLRTGPHPDLRHAIARLARIRRGQPALQHGDYRQLHVAPECLAFLRTSAEGRIAIVVNAAGDPVDLTITLPGAGDGRLVDILNDETTFPVRGGTAAVGPVPPRWARILRLEDDAAVGE